MNAIDICSAMLDAADAVPADQWESHWQNLETTINSQNVVSADDSKRLSIIAAILKEWRRIEDEDGLAAGEDLYWRMGMSSSAGQEVAEEMDEPQQPE